jgi:hypothetical protein
MTDTTQDDDFYPATAGDDPIWLGGVEYIIKSRSDELVQAAVAAALREAAEAAEDYYSDLGDWLAKHGHSVSIRDYILALITPDAQAALDRVVAAERERCARVAEQKAGAGSHAIAAAIREGRE